MSTIQTTDRFAVVGTSIHDREADRIARFQNAGVAQLGADWLNGPDATPEDYEWVNAADMTSDEWVAVHPEVTAAAPGWANRITAEDDCREVAISYDLVLDSLEVGMAGSWRDGRVVVDDARAYVYFHFDEKPVTAADLRAFAADFIAAAEALEGRQSEH